MTTAPGALPNHSLLLHDVAAAVDHEPGAARVLVVVPTKGRPHRASHQISSLPAEYDVLLLATAAQDLPGGLSHPGLRQHVGHWPDPGGPRFATPHPDLAAKRNFGMAVARDEGYDAVIFLDDDIDVTPGHLRPMVTALETQAIVGRRPVGLADHSMLYQVLGRAGLATPFVSGSCLAARAHYPGTFPHIYNEDWFFMWPALCRGEVARMGDVRQVDLGNTGFRPARAAAEEPGDILAEGFLRALHESDGDAGRSSVESSLRSETFWARAVQRRHFLYELAHTVISTSRWPDHLALMANLDTGKRTLTDLTVAQLTTRAVQLCAVLNTCWTDEMSAAKGVTR